MIYFMSKTESQQWKNQSMVETDSKGNIKSNIRTKRKFCRDLIRDIAAARGCSAIHNDHGIMVE